MNAKMIGASLATAALVAFPLAACGSSPAPTVTTVTTTATTLAPCPPVNDPGWEACFDAHRAQREHDAAAKTPTAAPPQAKSSGLPWWSWLLIVPAAGIGLLVLGFKSMEWNDERTIRRAEARVDELDARAEARRTRVLDYDDYEDDEEDDEDELPADDIEFLHRVTDPAPSTSAQPTQPAAGGLLSSLRQQNQ
ncbi:hypothetical protein [Mycobacteroides abscessus]|uniref:hypothetical protein n=1 Tax=Mycobacteroides abscessus TaxID=36809 RepID=UPI000926E612|nr:hypothetical protein [Mycobacteroides abscessus]SHX81860.1 putative lipoprotein [Mycobacteroides abscessus subsp. abscessus]SKM69753.1 putative lipoprotein [Mycobacteroides abscessus subsp. abscessus]SKN72840.1 putative lipoprotein [Mycobacteroides abscessus subsp. abscessus]SKR46436.1 Uncharacterised protein [Mycobacteroides abscessus subsp. abscessus]SKR62987.1 Uncharacterised protein [Mycobacteroides abscessus subsp. abscessus]